MVNLGTDKKTRSPVFLSDDARRQGTYIIGATGTGKTQLLERIAVADMADSSAGFCVLDPHGDFVERLLTLIPAKRRDDVILFDPSADDQSNKPLGLNILACDRSSDLQKSLVVSTVISTLYKLFSHSWGPRMEDLLRNSILTLMEKPDSDLLDLWLLLASKKHRQLFTGITFGTLPKGVRDRGMCILSDPYLRQFWEVQMAEMDSRTITEVMGSSLNKLGRFLSDPRLRNIVSQSHNAFDLKDVMDNGKILLVNLSKGSLGEDNSALLGSVIVNLILIAALQRKNVPLNQRRRFHLIVDEYQSFATSSFPMLQSEARKYGIDLIVAHQYRDQLDDLNKGSTLNVGNFITLRVSGRDSLELAMQFDNAPPPAEKTMRPVFSSSEIYTTNHSGQKVRTFAARDSIDGGKGLFEEVALPPRPFSDVQAEKANQLSTLQNLQGVCRLIGDKGGLVEQVIEWPYSADAGDIQTAKYIRGQSLRLGLLREEVERSIAQRIRGLSFDTPTPISETEPI